MSQKKPMTHGERAARRKLIAKHLGEHGIRATAAHFGVSLSMIVNTAREHGITVKTDREYKPTGNQKAPPFAILKQLLDGKKVQLVVKEFGVSRQRVYQIKEAAVAAGFEL